MTQHNLRIHQAPLSDLQHTRHRHHTPFLQADSTSYGFDITNIEGQ
jgi:hypothetical protein